MTKTLIPTENSKTNRQHKNVTQNFHYTTIVDRLRTVSWSNKSQSTGVVNPGLKGTNLPTHRKSSVIVHFKIDILFIIQTDFHKDGYMLKAKKKNQMKNFYTI